MRLHAVAWRSMSRSVRSHERVALIDREGHPTMTPICGRYAGIARASLVTPPRSDVAVHDKKRERIMAVATEARTDIEIQNDVLAELNWEPRVQRQDIGVSVKNGIVTLSGWVDSYTKKWAAEQAAHR